MNDILHPLDEIVMTIRGMIEGGAYHKKRGFSLCDCSSTDVSIHLIEEVVELQAEVLVTKDKEAVLEEAADVLATFIHLLEIEDISLREVAKRCEDKLFEIFTSNKDEVLTDTPGLTRQSRK